MNSGMVFNIQRFSLHDGPGIRTVLFLKGCSLRCKWCCNPESQSPQPEIMFTKSKCVRCGTCVSVCPSRALLRTIDGITVEHDRCSGCGLCVTACAGGALVLSGKELEVDEVVADLVRDRLYYETSCGGVTLSGGDPLLQDRFSAQILSRLKSLQIHTAIETAGCVPWHSFERVMDYTDLFLYDLKHFWETEHKAGTAKSNDLIISNLNRLLDLEKRVIVRLPLIPGFNTMADHRTDLIGFLQRTNIEEIHLLPYHRLGVNKYEKLGRTYDLGHLIPPTNKEVDRMRREFADRLHANVVVYG